MHGSNYSCINKMPLAAPDGPCNRADATTLSSGVALGMWEVTSQGGKCHQKEDLMANASPVPLCSPLPRLHSSGDALHAVPLNT